MYSKEYHKRECLDDAYVYSTMYQQWTPLKWKGIFYSRRYHTAYTVGKHLIVHGGIDSLEKYQSEIEMLNLGSKKQQLHQWCTLETEGPSPGNVANHTSVVILSPARCANNDESGVYSLAPESGTESKVFFKKCEEN